MTSTDALPVDPSNAEQAQAWDGNEGEYWALNAERFEQSVARYNGRFFDAARIEPTSHVLDIGCGTGDTTRAAARLAWRGSALGMDLSTRMLQVAREAAEREATANVRFEQADAQIHPFAAEQFDSAISRTGAMFFGNPQVAFANIGRALRPGGRLVLLVWQALPNNEWIREIGTALAAGRDLPLPPPEAPGPFSLSDPDRVRPLLSSAGFTDVVFEGLNEPMFFGADVDDALQFVVGLLGWMLEGLDESARAHALDTLRGSMTAHATDHGVLYGSATWLVTAERS